MPRRYPEEFRRQVVDLARAGTKVAQLSKTFGVSDATIYNWLKRERIDRGEIEGLSTEQVSELAAAKRRIRQLETELAVSRRHRPMRRCASRGGCAARPGSHKRSLTDQPSGWLIWA